MIRYSLLICLLACSSNSSPRPQEPPSPDQAKLAAPTQPAVEACDWARPDFAKMGPVKEVYGDVTVDDAGREPRAVRVYREPAVATVRYHAHKTGRMRDTKGSGPAREWEVAPVLDLEVEWLLEEADAAGARQFAFRVTKVDADASAATMDRPQGATPADLAEMWSMQERALIGQKLEFGTEPNGAFTPRTPNVAQFPDLAYMLLSFPSQAIGEGATWGKSDELSGGISVIDRHRFELLEVKGDRLRVGFELRQERNAFRQILEDGTPQEYTMVVVVRGDVVVDLAGAPIEASWTLTSTMDNAQCRSKKLERGRLEMQNSWTWKAR